MFKPKITPGPWKPIIDKNKRGVEYLCGVEGRRQVITPDERCIDIDSDDLKAICAVPELLKVYEAAKRFVSLKDPDGFFDLEVAIEELEERLADAKV